MSLAAFVVRSGEETRQVQMCVWTISSRLMMICVGSNGWLIGTMFARRRGRFIGLAVRAVTWATAGLVALLPVLGLVAIVAALYGAATTGSAAIDGRPWTVALSLAGLAAIVAIALARSARPARTWPWLRA